MNTSLATLLGTALAVTTLFSGCGGGSGEDPGDTPGYKSSYASADASPLRERRAELVFHVTVEPSEPAGRVRLWLPYPVSSESQLVSDVRVTGNHSYAAVHTEREFGNAMLYAEWEDPTVRPEISLSLRVLRLEILRKNFPAGSEPPVPPDVSAVTCSSADGAACELAAAATARFLDGKKSLLEKAEAIYDHLVTTYERDEAVPGCGSGDAATVLGTKKGKCADIHAAFTALAASAGVPAREVFGIRIPTGNEGDMTKAYHCRAEFYLPGYGWVPVDASDVLKVMAKEGAGIDQEKTKAARHYFFGAQNENFVDFGRGRNLTLNPPQEAGKLPYFMYPYAEVDGRPLDHHAQQELKYQVTFRELAGP